MNALGHDLVRLQDLEFRVPISAIQVTRKFTRSVGLGGNGQFSRLSALDVVADEDGPWRGALLEDYELSLHLMMTGHRNEYTQDTWVDQEALPDIGGWSGSAPGGVRAPCSAVRTCGSCGPRRHVSKIGALEATYYLVQPWLQLIGTFVYPVPAIVFVTNYLAGPAAMRAWVVAGGWMILAFYLDRRARAVHALGSALPQAVRAAAWAVPRPWRSASATHCSC